MPINVNGYEIELCNTSCSSGPVWPFGVPKQHINFFLVPRQQQTKSHYSWLEPIRKPTTVTSNQQTYVYDLKTILAAKAELEAFVNSENVIPKLSEDDIFLLDTPSYIVYQALIQKNDQVLLLILDEYPRVATIYADIILQHLEQSYNPTPLTLTDNINVAATTNSTDDPIDIVSHEKFIVHVKQALEKYIQSADVIQPLDTRDYDLLSPEDFVVYEELLTKDRSYLLRMFLDLDTDKSHRYAVYIHRHLQTLTPISKAVDDLEPDSSFNVPPSQRRNSVS